MRLELVAAGVVVGLNLAAFLLYGWDKRAARLDRRRISERSLLLAAGLGGLLGAWVGMSVFRHKTKKRSFQAKLLAVTACWVGAGVLAYRQWGG